VTDAFGAAMAPLMRFFSPLAHADLTNRNRRGCWL
jgi:hypothetical protein